MKQETFLQNYRDDAGDVHCWWGTACERMSFFVFDRTIGLHPSITFGLHAGPNGNRGVLRVDGDERSLDGTSLVVEITDSGITETAVPKSASQLKGYLEDGQYGLSLAGMLEYHRTHSA